VLNDTPYMADIRAVVGARVSHVQGEEKTSHISQRGKGEAYAESQNWTVVGSSVLRWRVLHRRPQDAVAYEVVARFGRRTPHDFKR
jgi:hypothetical protein